MVSRSDWPTALGSLHCACGNTQPRAPLRAVQRGAAPTRNRCSTSAPPPPPPSAGRRGLPSTMATQRRPARPPATSARAHISAAAIDGRRPVPIVTGPHGWPPPWRSRATCTRAGFSPSLSSETSPLRRRSPRCVMTRPSETRSGRRSACSHLVTKRAAAVLKRTWLECDRSRSHTSQPLLIAISSRAPRHKLAHRSACGYTY